MFGKNDKIEVEKRLPDKPLQEIKPIEAYHHTAAPMLKKYWYVIYIEEHSANFVWSVHDDYAGAVNWSIDVSQATKGRFKIIDIVEGNLSQGKNQPANFRK